MVTGRITPIMRGDRISLIIDADPPSGPGQYSYTVNYLEMIFYWKDGSHKVFERWVFTENSYAIVSLVDLGKNNKVGFALDIRNPEFNAMMIAVGKCAKKDHIKFFEGSVSAIEYISDTNSTLREFEVNKSTFRRTKQFDDPSKSGEEIADDVASLLEDKGFVENPPD